MREAPNGHSELFKQVTHWGFVGRQTCCPKPTNKWLTSLQYSLGSQSSSPFLVSSGVLLLTHPSRFVIRCTWVSTPIPVTSPQAVFIQRCAILGPTPGSLHKLATVFGMSPLYSFFSNSVVFFMYFTLFY